MRAQLLANLLLISSSRLHILALFCFSCPCIIFTSLLVLYRRKSFSCARFVWTYHNVSIYPAGIALSSRRYFLISRHNAKVKFNVHILLAHLVLSFC